MPDWTRLILERLDLSQLEPRRRERMIQELADYLEDVYRAARQGGATEEESRAQALDCLGDAPRNRVRMRVPGRRGTPSAIRPRNVWWTSLADRGRDFRFALRALSKKPLFTGVVVLVLSLGIGATTAIFTLLDAVVLSPLPFDEADRLVVLGHEAPNVGRGNVGQCAAWHLTYEEENRVFEDLGMYGSGAPTVTGIGEPEAVPALFVTSGVFRVLRMTPALGRLFTREDDDLNAPALVILSHPYWQNRFGGDPDVLGRTIEVNGVSREIVGVAPPTLVSLGQDPSLIMPLRFNRSTLFVGNVGYGSVVRLKDGVTMEEAAADMARMLPMAFEKFPGGPVSAAAREANYIPIVRPLKATLVGSVSNLLWVLLGGVAVVLLIACANVANLFLVHAEGKGVEMAVRAALGAGRRRIAWEYLKESVLLGVLGGAGGLVLAFAGLRALVAAAPVQLPRLQEVSLDPNIFLFTLAVAVGAGLFFGIFPALRHGRSGLVDALKQGGPSGVQGRDRQRVQNTLAVSQMALALLLLVASGLMLRTSRALKSVDPGFRHPQQVLALWVYITQADSPDAEGAALVQEQIARRLAEVPGVTSVGMATDIPMTPGGNINPLFVEGITTLGEAPPRTERHIYLGEGYLETLQIPLVAGRSFTWQDIHNRIPAALVSESLARRYWGSAEEAMGKRIAVRPDPVRWHEIIGVVADVRDDGMSQDPVPLVYWPQVLLGFWQGGPLDQVTVWRGVAYSVRSDRVGTPGFLEQVREAVWEVNPNLPVRNPRTFDGLMAASMARTSFTFVLLSIAAGVALVLGLVGVYGVITYAVSQRRREMGMRIALGARALDVTSMVLRQGMMFAIIGLPIGLAMAVGLTRLMSGLLFGVSALDPVTFVLVPVGLLLVTLLASYVPARRAARIDPMAALRDL